MKYAVLRGDYNKLKSILEHFGFVSIAKHGKTLRFGFSDSSTQRTEISLDVNTLKFYNFKTFKSGDLIDLIREKTHDSFMVAKGKLESLLGSSLVFEKVNTEHRFDLDDFIENDVKTLKRYDLEVLDKYPSLISELFLKDKIGAFTQFKFDIRYDYQSGRIIIPIKDDEGELVGAIGRLNQRKVPAGVPKYYPLIAYPKKQIVFGLYENKEYIKNNIVYVIESEKSVLAAFSMGFHNVVAIGGSVLHPEQIQLIKKYMPKRIIVVLDKGLSDDHYKEQAERLVSNNAFYKPVIGYLQANKCDLLDPLENPFDKDKETAETILNDYISYL